ncbi:hypothetical protein [Clostridium lundense]|uniref:hypothetical protein n=1 Tax=Clostridium lundense TaxID=319475 RepID=UPI0006851302|nr:hypothetical protein [Clostridium lundense]
MISLFNKKSIIVIIVVLLVFIFAGCSKKTNKSDISLNGTKDKNETYTQSNVGTTSENSTTPSKNNNKTSEAFNKSYDNTSQGKYLSSKDNVKNKVHSGENITEKVKNYIINGQENKLEAQKIKWSKTFLNRVDIESLYKQYIANGGHADDLEDFANYMTLNAPISNDWQGLFKKDLYDTYGEKVVRLEHLEGDLYQAYIIKNGSEVPYVVVSSRTGYFHG